MSMSEAPRRPTVGILLSRPAHFIALGAGSGLSPIAPGTVGTLWAWLSFVALQMALSGQPQADLIWAAILLLGWPLGCWACTRTAQHLRISDPGAIVWDEIWAFWLMLWLIGPVGWLGQLGAFVAFRFFDAAKPGPVAWADALFKAVPGQPIGWRQGLGIMLDDLVAAACALLVLALGVAVRDRGVLATLFG